MKLVMKVKVLIKRPIVVHGCKLPGWWSRRFNGLGVGSVVKCEYCDKQYKLRPASGSDGQEHWEYGSWV